MNSEIAYFSSELITSPKYKVAAKRLFTTLEEKNIKYALIENTKDIWVRDFMPVVTKSGKCISFKYAPSYHETEEEKKQRTHYKDGISEQFPELDIIYSDINLDGGNVVFSPSKNKAIISDRIFSENEERNRDELLHELSQLLEAEIIIIPSLKEDMTGHADGMVRFINENTVIGNRTGEKFEERIKGILGNHGFKVYDFPYFWTGGEYDATGCYINFLETKDYIFLPSFSNELDKEAVNAAETLFSNKEIVPVNINEIAEQGGVLNCISWEGYEKC